MLTCRLALGAVLAFALAARADDPPKPPADENPPAEAPKADDKPADAPKPPASGTNPNANKPQMHSVGQVILKVSKVDGSTLTTKVTEMERSTNGNNGGSRRGKGGSAAHTHPVEKDKDYDLASDVRVRWKDLPKGPDGKAKQYTDKEYKALLEPAGAPGYKADMSDLKSGQTVRLYLSKGSAKEDKVVVTTVMIIADAPKGSDTKDADEKPKKKKKE